MTRGALLLLAVMIGLGAAVAQEETAAEAPAVDMTDPAAIVQAYVDACERRDVEAALPLTNLDEGMQATFRTMAAGMTGRPDMQTMLLEMSFAPIGLRLATTVGKGSVEGDTARVTATPTPPREQTFLLQRQEDGTWRIDLEQSILASTQRKTSLLFMDAQRMSARSQAAAGQSNPWEARQRLRRITNDLTEYAREKGQFPDAETWMDDLEAHHLDPAVCDVSEAFGEKYGVAMNAEIAGQPYLQGWGLRRGMLALFVSTDTSRNASGDPDDELEALAEDRPGLQVCFASGEPVLIPRDMLVAEALLSLEHADVSQQRVRALVEALLTYARDNEGQLPPAESWCDDALGYAPPEQVTEEVLQCPAADLDYAWAMNAELAGKNIRTLKSHDDYVLLLPAEAGVRNEVRTVPERLAEGRYLTAWADDARLAVTIGMLDGNTRTWREGDPCPRPSRPGDDDEAIRAP